MYLGIEESHDIWHKLRYSFGIVYWCQEELQKLYRAMRKLLTINGQQHPQADVNHLYVGYLESKYHLRIFLAHPRDCHFAHVQSLSLSIEKPQTPFCEIRVMFMFVPVC